MTKKKFIRQLSKALGKLKAEERDRYLAYYDEVISDLMESGSDESSACGQQGSVEEIATNIYENAGQDMFKKRDWLELILLFSGAILAAVSLVFLFHAQGIGVLSFVNVDGPTSVFVAGKIGDAIVLYIVTLVVIIAGLVYNCVRKHKAGIIVSIITLALFAGTWLIHDRMKDRAMEDSHTGDEIVRNSPVDEISDEDFIQELTENIIFMLDAGDYDTLADTYATETMKQYLNDEYMDSARKMISDDWGEYRFMGTIYTQDIRENGVDYTVAQVTVTYEKVSVTYTITYDSEFMLAGLFIK